MTGGAAAGTSMRGGGAVAACGSVSGGAAAAGGSAGAAASLSTRPGSHSCWSLPESSGVATPFGRSSPRGVSSIWVMNSAKEPVLYSKTGVSATAGGPLSSGTRNSPQVWQKLASAGLRCPWLQRCPTTAPHTPQTSIPGETECPPVHPGTPTHFHSLLHRLTMLRDPAAAGDELDEAGHRAPVNAQVRGRQFAVTNNSCPAGLRHYISLTPAPPWRHAGESGSRDLHLHR